MSSSTLKKLDIPKNWTFKDGNVVLAFDAHVREQLPWYDLATGVVAHIARHYVPEDGVVIEVGASTGNIGRALASMLAARRASFLPLDNSPAMAAGYSGPGELDVIDVRQFDFEVREPDVIIAFLVLMFVPVADRLVLIQRMRRSLRRGGALIVFDKITPRGGYLGTVGYRLTLAAKYEAGAAPDEIIAKELSLAGVQRPLDPKELDGFAEVFRFGDFAGFVYERQDGDRRP